MKKELSSCNKKVQMVADLQRRQVQESDDKVTQLNVRIEALLKKDQSKIQDSKKREVRVDRALQDLRKMVLEAKKQVE